MEVKKKLLRILWLFPFCFFLCGYFVIQFFLKNQNLYVPNVVGKNLQTSIKILSKMRLGCRLLEEKEDLDLPEGIVLNQFPASGQQIKQNQNVLLTISKRPKPILTPNFISLSQEQVHSRSTKIGIRTKKNWFNSLYPINSCIAQSPSVGQKLLDKEVIVYFSQGLNNLFVVPNLQNICIRELKNIINNKDIELDLLHKDKNRSYKNLQDCFVVDQKPIPGSIVDLNKKLYLQLLVQD